MSHGLIMSLNNLFVLVVRLHNYDHMDIFPTEQKKNVRYLYRSVDAELLPNWKDKNLSKTKALLALFTHTIDVFCHLLPTPYLAHCDLCHAHHSCSLLLFSTWQQALKCRFRTLFDNIPLLLNILTLNVEEKNLQTMKKTVYSALTDFKHFWSFFLKHKFIFVFLLT